MEEIFVVKSAKKKTTHTPNRSNKKVFDQGGSGFKFRINIKFCLIITSLFLKPEWAIDS